MHNDWSDLLNQKLICAKCTFQLVIHFNSVRELPRHIRYQLLLIEEHLVCGSRIIISIVCFPFISTWRRDNPIFFFPRLPVRLVGCSTPLRCEHHLLKWPIKFHFLLCWTNGPTLLTLDLAPSRQHLVGPEKQMALTFPPIFYGHQIIISHSIMIISISNECMPRNGKRHWINSVRKYKTNIFGFVWK